MGESLPGAARRLLGDMGLWAGFAEDSHSPRHVHRGAWGGPEPVERHSLGDPDGHGWNLDRLRFEQRLRATAIVRGAVQVAPARPIAVERADRGWRLTLAGDGATTEVAARLVIDATGRSSRLLSPHGARRRVDDRLVCGWTRVRTDLPGGVTQIEAEADGWWYAAPLPGGEALLAFHTDADLPAARAGRTPAALLERVRTAPMLGRLFEQADLSVSAAGYCAAHGARLDRPAGDGWLACGDAALAFDPLSAQGLFNALYTGLAAAETADRMLDGDSDAGAAYAADLDRVWAAYRAHRAAWYGLEPRWTDRPFWNRRRSMGPDAPTRAAAAQAPARSDPDAPSGRDPGRAR